MALSVLLKRSWSRPKGKKFKLACAGLIGNCVPASAKTMDLVVQNFLWANIANRVSIGIIKHAFLYGASVNMALPDANPVQEAVREQRPGRIMFDPDHRRFGQPNVGMSRMEIVVLNVMHMATCQIYLYLRNHPQLIGNRQSRRFANPSNPRMRLHCAPLRRRLPARVAAVEPSWRPI